jgi:hypothetical protein
MPGSAATIIAAPIPIIAPNRLRMIPESMVFTPLLASSEAISFAAVLLSLLKLEEIVQQSPWTTLSPLHAVFAEPRP